MNRFEKRRGNIRLLRRFLPILVFCAVILLFIVGLSSLSGSTAREEAESLEDSILKSAVHCYALEGFYPEDISYLEDNYGIVYDREKYVVSYEVIGENRMPDIMVIPLKNKGGDGI